MIAGGGGLVTGRLTGYSFEIRKKKQYIFVLQLGTIKWHNNPLP